MIPLFVIGLNHETATIDLREQVTFAPESVVPALQDIVRLTRAREAAILSTCNRTEIYFSGQQSKTNALEQVQLSATELLNWFAQYHGLDVGELSKHCYVHKGSEAMVHMMRVACGLDSMVLGEPQILGQMKSSYAVAIEAKVLGSELHSIFQRVFSVAKQVRTETAIGRNPVSVAYAAVNLAQRIFSNLKNDTALLIGAGETIDLVALHLKEQGVSKMLFANRTLERAQKLADEFGAKAILLADIPEYLVSADIVISSTASQLPILGKGAVESALKLRKHKPFFMVDIAVPRDIEPEVGNLDDVYLYTVDDLHDVIDENKQSREIAAQQAHVIVENNVGEFFKEQRARHSVETIKSYRQYAGQLSEEVLQKSLRDLHNGADAEELLRKMAKGLTNKLLHSPTQQLKQAGVEGRYDLIEFSQQLFGFAESENVADISVDKDMRNNAVETKAAADNKLN
jgi:glutamyl-tRNA reductase